MDKKMAKKREWICPICNSDDTTEISIGCEVLCAYSLLRCDKCGAEWDDNFSVQYCGYNIETEDGDTKIYNAEGKEI